MDISTIVGLSITLIFCVFISHLKNKKIYYSLLAVAIILSLVRFNNSNDLGVIIGMNNCNTADFLFSPLVYLLLFQILRMVFIEVNKKEPAFGAGRFSNFDKKENRTLTTMDYAVEVIPLVVAVLCPFVIAKLIR